MEKMKLGVIGIGAVGSAISKGFEYLGHDVVGYDIKIPETKIEDTLDTEIVFITVGTPTGPNDECDLTAVNSAIKTNIFSGTKKNDILKAPTI